jgi:hypothetical protein
MGFPSRLKKVRDANVPVPKRVMALLDALTHCHVGYAEGKVEHREQFGWEVGQPVSSETLVAIADYLSEQWVLRGRRCKG